MAQNNKAISMPDTITHKLVGSVIPRPKGKRQKILAASLANYDGPCPCPYSGLNCKGRSVSDLRREPLCFISDVTPEMIARFRANQI
jgi:hypothetical protein